MLNYQRVSTTLKIKRGLLENPPSLIFPAIDRHVVRGVTFFACLITEELDVAGPFWDKPMLVGGLEY